MTGKGFDGEGYKAMTSDFLSRMERRELVVGVVGLGYVGLPLVIGFGEVGYQTVGFDVDAERVAALNRGISHIEDVTSSRIETLLEASRFEATTESEVLGRADAIFIAVPTPFDEAKTPDLAYVRSATSMVQSILRPGMLVILQSTTFPGTTKEVVQPILEQTGLRAGIDFELAFSPERVDPGSPHWNLRNTPKVVGGITEDSAQHAAALLESAMERSGLVTVLSSPEAAELTKLLENTYRAVNIALVNELAMLCHEMNIDVWEVIDGAATKPFGFQAFYPGIGPGGHCIPVDPYYLSWRAKMFDFSTKFIELAAETNLHMAGFVVRRVQSLLNGHSRPLKGSRILCYGAAFKPNVSDMRNSRAVRVMELLSDAGADIRYHDPRVPTFHLGAEWVKSVDFTKAEIDQADLVLVLVAHPELPLDLLIGTSAMVFDAVNATKGQGGHRVERL